ncbi:MAG TPA: sigma-70 family RNA polymerase sigma factor [Ktedonobacteraceae bacterium]
MERPSYFDPAPKVAPSASDGDLVARARAGNQEAFEMLVERYRVPLYQFISRFFEDYDQRCDVLQQVLIQLYISLPNLQTHRSLQAWMFRVARNRCLDELRRKHVPNFTEMAWEGNEDEALCSAGVLMLAPSVEEQVEQHELEHLLYQVITDLPPKYRPIVWLRYTTLLNFGEIGRTLHIPEATAKTYFQRAKARMRQSLGELQS